MPQIHLEYSSNLIDQPDLVELFTSIHQLLPSVAGIRIDNCKSRAREANDFLIGDGNESNAFIHLSVRFIEGRPAEVNQAIGEQRLAILKQSYSASVVALKLPITVEVEDIARETYFKHPEGSLTPL